jgi:hypothetical protein
MKSKNKTTQSNEARKNETILEPSNKDAYMEVVEFLHFSVSGPNRTKTLHAMEQILIEDTGYTPLEAHRQVRDAFNRSDGFNPKYYTQD